ncbi:hypothetical protein GCM10022219_11640 [Microbacterium oryzae]|uniref:hypothetical protein n=1 Tax=Microbacterium oryzae TaxID=743009 RepID=UPI0012E0D825|nr:hypothetical protein [Microbacterium oryzae]
MAKFKINDEISGASLYKTIEAKSFRQDGEYFVFVDNTDRKVFAVAARLVVTIEKDSD